MSRVLIVGEDLLCCALAERIVASTLPAWKLSSPTINAGGVTKLRSALHRYAKQARHVQPVFCLADTDGQCALEWLQQWRPPYAPTSLILRLAVNEAESWVLADRAGFSRYMEVPISKIPKGVDQLTDPKGLVLQLVGKSRKRQFRTEMVSATDPAKQGSGYNLHMQAFVKQHWDTKMARELSPSLDRAIRQLCTLGTTLNT